MVNHGVEVGMNGHLELLMKVNLKMVTSMVKADGRRNK
jgi:hypothetical protein